MRGRLDIDNDWDYPVDIEKINDTIYHLTFPDSWKSFKNIMQYKFLFDGSPCGVLVDNKYKELIHWGSLKVIEDGKVEIKETHDNTSK